MLIFPPSLLTDKGTIARVRRKTEVSVPVVNIRGDRRGSGGVRRRSLGMIAPAF